MFIYFPSHRHENGLNTSKGDPSEDEGSNLWKPVLGLNVKN